MPRRASGRIVCWENGSLWLMRTDSPVAQKTSPHAHHAIQVTVGLEGAFAFEAEGKVVRGEAVAIAPDTLHTFELQGRVAHVFFEPDGRVGRAASASLFSSANVVALESPVVKQLKEALQGSAGSLVELGRAFVQGLSGAANPAPTDVRVQRMIAWAEERLGGPIELAEAADAVGLSKGRARHVFVEQTGLPFRAFLLWRRLNLALKHYAEGGALTEAAYAAGFSDSAHLSRTFRRMFGVAAAELWLARK